LLFFEPLLGVRMGSVQYAFDLWIRKVFFIPDGYPPIQPSAAFNIFNGL
jgi:hypothetical protein